MNAALERRVARCPVFDRTVRFLAICLVKKRRSNRTSTCPVFSSFVHCAANCTTPSIQAYGGRNHVCNILWLSVKGCGCSERGKFAFSHWLDASLLQHCDLVTFCAAEWTVAHRPHPFQTCNSLVDLVFDTTDPWALAIGYNADHIISYHLDLLRRHSSNVQQRRTIQ